MRALVIGLALLWTVAAGAQDRNYTVTLTAAQVNYLYSLLKKQPWEDVAVLLSMIQTQAGQQDQAAQNAAMESLRKQIEEAKAKEPPNGPPPPGQ